MGWTKRTLKQRDAFERLYADVMVDIETMGTGADTQVISIGAVRWRLDQMDDESTLAEEDRTFYARLDLASQASKGRTTAADTLKWWSKQSPAARAVFDEEEESVARALNRFSRFCRGAKRIWGNGNMFDNTVIRSLYTTYDKDYPVEYWNDLDVRSLKYFWNKLTNYMFNGKMPDIKFGEAHNALDDACRQVLQCQQMYRDCKGTKYGSEEK